MHLRELADSLLESSVVLSFTDIGYAARKRMFGWNDMPAGAMQGRVVAITGATSGLGLATAWELAGLGAALRLLVRDGDKGETVAEQIHSRYPACDVTVYRVDLGDLDAVRRTVEEFDAQERRLDVLINNAGALLRKRQVTAQGFEATFASMVLGPFALTNGLAPLLTRTATDHGRARIINVASGGMYTQGLHLDDLQFAREPYRGSVAYARAKRALVVLTEIWARQLRDASVTVNGMHPGWAATPGIAASLPKFERLLGRRLRTPEEGADTIVWLAASDEAARWTGKFWLDRRPRSTTRLPGTRVSAESAAGLWTACREMTGNTSMH